MKVAVLSFFPFVNTILLWQIHAVEALLHYTRFKVSSTRSFRHIRPRNADVGLEMRLNPTSFEGTNYVITEFPRPALRRVPNAPIETFDDALVQKTKEMFTVMYGCKGVGLAAPQIGLNEMLFVSNPSGDIDMKNMERVVCNPVITEYSKEVDVEEEACLSLRSDFCPGLVARFSWIQVEYQNELGQKIRRRLKGFEARVFQHEYDHLMGILCYDRFPPENRQAIRANIEELLKAYPEKDALVDPVPKQYDAMKPPPLTARQMALLLEEENEAEAPKKKKAAPAKTGFGGAGSSSQKSKTKKKRNKK